MESPPHYTVPHWQDDVKIEVPVQSVMGAALAGSLEVLAKI